MFCSTCGSQIQDGTNFCPNCGAQVGAPPVGLQQQQGQFQGVQQGAPVKVNDYLIWNILATIFCCLITGLIGVVFSVKAQKAAAVGDAERAISAAGTAKLCFWISVVFLVVMVILAMTGNLQQFADLPVE